MIKTPWPTIIDDTQGFLSSGLSLMPQITEMMLEALAIRERTHKDLCLVPASRLELYHLRLERKVRTRIQHQRAA